MSITNYISADILRKEGFIHHKDKDGLIRAVVKQSPELGRIPMPATSIAHYLGVKKDRVYWYLKHKGIGNELTLSEVLTMDWSEITDISKGDKKRKRTYLKFD